MYQPSGANSGIVEVSGGNDVNITIGEIIIEGPEPNGLPVIVDVTGGTDVNVNIGEIIFDEDGSSTILAGTQTTPSSSAPATVAPKSDTVPAGSSTNVPSNTQQTAPQSTSSVDSVPSGSSTNVISSATNQLTTAADSVTSGSGATTSSSTDTIKSGLSGTGHGQQNGKLTAGQEVIHVKGADTIYGGPGAETVFSAAGPHHAGQFIKDTHGTMTVNVDAKANDTIFGGVGHNVTVDVNQSAANYEFASNTHNKDGSTTIHFANGQVLDVKHVTIHFTDKSS